MAIAPKPHSIAAEIKDCQAAGSTAASAEGRLWRHAAGSGLSGAAWELIGDAL